MTRKTIVQLLKKISIDLLIVVFHGAAAIRKIIFFFAHVLCKTLLQLLGFFLKRPLIISYTLHLRTRLHLANLGIRITNPFVHALSSKLFLHLSLLGIAILISVVNLTRNETEDDPLQSRTILATYLRGDEESLFVEEDEEGESKEAAYHMPAAVRSDTPIIEEKDRRPLLSGPGGVAVVPGALIKPILPTTEAPITQPYRLEIYIVREGDTLSGIAQKFGVKINTLLWANSLDGDQPLRIGQKLTILPVNGVLYRIRKGDTLERIARTFNVDIQKISSMNGLADTHLLAIGNLLIIPDAVLYSRPPQQPRGLANRIRTIFQPQPRSARETKLITPSEMIWPTTARRITQYFGWRHSGVDIAGPVSNKIIAAAAGTIIISGWQRGYGKTIVIDHGNGKRTRYGHASKLLVSIGDNVQQGETIAMIGSTGRSTGPHLHFEIIVNGRRVNPFSYIHR